MRLIWAFIIISIGWLVAGCTSEADRDAIRQMEQAATLMQSDPQEAYALLSDSVDHPELLSPKVNARWCRLLCQLADSIGTALPYVPQLKQAYQYVERHGSVEEQIQMGLYLGRAYMDDLDQESALLTYAKVLEQSIEEGKTNQSGYISSYMGDVYQFQGMYSQAVEKYLSASRYFHQAGNFRSQGIAFRDVSRNFAVMDSLDIALDYMLQADSIMMLYGDSIGRSGILNGLGNIYRCLEDAQKAECFFKKAIEFDSLDVSPSYLALADLEIQQHNYEKARFYLKQAERPTHNKGTAIEIPYVSYQIEKELGNKNEAFACLEQYVALSDSILFKKSNAEVKGLEDKYRYSLLLAKHFQLKSIKTKQTAFLVVTLLFALFLYFYYKVRIERKNNYIYQQALELEQKNNILLVLKNDLQQKQLKLEMLNRQMSQQEAEWQELYEKTIVEISQKEEEIKQQTLSIWNVSPITLRLQSLVRKVNPSTTKSPLEENDWIAIRELVRTLYPAVDKAILAVGLKGHEEELCYLSMFRFDTNQEAILLNATINSVNTYRRNVRKKLQIQSPSQKLCDFLMTLK